MEMMTEVMMESIDNELCSICQMLTDQYQELSERHQRLTQDYHNLEEVLHVIRINVKMTKHSSSLGVNKWQ